MTTAQSIREEASARSPHKTKYRPEIDGLRAFAVVAVIINHFNKDLLPGGYLGVDIFFVISGYVITSSLDDRQSKNFGDFIGGFYERRIKRLVPALTVFVLITSIAICLFNPQPWLTLKTGIASLFGISNLFLLGESTDYFAQSTELNVFTHTWSLGVEEQFYILFPFLIWFSGFGRQTRNGARNLFLTVGILSAISLLSFLHLYPLNQPAAYFLMPTRFWEMAAGCLIFIGFKKRARIEQILETVPPFLVITCIVGVMFLPISYATVSTCAIVALSAILMASLKKNTAAFEFFTQQKVVYVGLISYSLYLWHWGVLSISRWTIGIHWWSVPFQIALMLGLAVASYRWIETPLRKATWFDGRWKTLLAGVGVLVATSGGLVALGKPLKGVMYLGEDRGDQTELAIRNKWRNEIKIPATSITGKLCHADDEYNEKDTTKLVQQCKYPLTRRNSTQRTVAFVGDSHALSLLNAEKQFIDSGFRVIHYSHGGCPYPMPPYGITPKTCENFLTKANSSLFNDLKKGDTIIIYNYHLSHLGGKNLKDTRHNIRNRNGGLPDTSDQKIKIYADGLRTLTEAARRRQIDVWLIGSSLRNNNIELRRERFRPNPTDESTLKEEYVNAKELNKKLSSYASVIGFKFIDPLSFLSKCANNMSEYHRCYRDSDHLSDEGANILIRGLLSKIKRQP